MKKLYLLLLLMPRPATAEEIINISPEQASTIGKKIWKNECAAMTPECLTEWNPGEEFPSLGIGHFIWYPKAYKGPFEEAFPMLKVFFLQKGAPMPKWLDSTEHCPWDSRSQFFNEFKSPKMVELRKFLKDTIPLQAQFEAERLKAALPKILAATAPENRASVRQQFYRVAKDPRGLYVLMDYVNFKTDGTLATARYKGKGWGLLQVLEGMTGKESGQPALDEFYRSALAALEQRVKNSPPERNEARWLPGWRNRLQTYRSNLN